MRVLPRSLRGRLLVIAAVTTLAALVVAGVGITGLLERYITGTVDTRLDDRLALFSATVTRDGAVDRALASRLDTYATRDGMWRIDAPRGSAGSIMIGGWLGIGFAGDLQLGPVAALVDRRHGRRPPEGHHDRSPDRHRDAGPPPHAPPPPAADAAGFSPTPFDARLADGTMVHGRWQQVPTDRGPASVAVAVPRALIDRPVRGAVAPLLAMLGLLGALLALATIVQLRIGLRPLDRLRAMLAEIRDGRRERIDLAVPTELQPVVTELNALIDANHAALERARSHVANLAHGLKTPLAALRLDLPLHDASGVLTPQVDRIEHQVRHHLGRARAASTGDFAAPNVALAPIVDDLATALGRIHADRDVRFVADVPAGLTLRCDRQDLEELLGNLLDNGWRHARARVTLEAVTAGRIATLTIADDGPGIPPDRLAEATCPGHRLDERGEGHGFGLSIARELIELHGGSLALRNAVPNGLIATITLPGGGG